MDLIGNTMTNPIADDPRRAAPAATSREVAPAATNRVVVKKYANRRLYNTESSSYITLDTLADMVREGRDFVVLDAKSGDDITRGVLTQIIVEEESKGRALLPTTFLRHLIGFYGDSMQGIVPRYLEQAMASFARQQEQVRLAMQQTVHQAITPFIPFGGGIEEVGRQNMAMMERAMTLFSPFHRDTEAGAGETRPAAASSEAPPEASHRAEVAALRAEIETLRGQLAVRTGGERTAAEPGRPNGAATPTERE